MVSILSVSEMNYGRAVTGQLMNSEAETEISAQAQIELGRELINEERSKLFGKFSPTNLIYRIKKVCNYFIMILL